VTGWSEIEVADSVYGYGTTCVKRAFTWTAAAGMTDLGVVVESTNAGDPSMSEARAINDKGVVVGVSTAMADGRKRAFVRIPAEGMRDLGALTPDGVSDATDINAAGQVVGSSMDPGPGYWVTTGFIWTRAGGMLKLAELPAGAINPPTRYYPADCYYPSAINDDGDVLGTVTDCGYGGFSYAIMWPQGGTPVVLYGGGGSGAVGVGINNVRQVVGSVAASTATGSAFLWTEATGAVLLPKPAWARECTGEGIDAAGNTVGTCWGDSGGGGIFWTPEGQMLELPNPPGLQVTARGMNDAGQVSGDGPVLWNVPIQRPNRAPAAASGGPYAGQEGAPIRFDGTGSSDPDGDALAYTWDFGDAAAACPGTTVNASAATPSHTYCDNGTYVLKLTVSDGQESATSTTTVTVSNVSAIATGATATPAMLTENQSYTVSLAGAVDPSAADVLEYRFDCGDGTGFGPWSPTATRVCVPPDNGSLTALAQMRDDDDAREATFNSQTYTAAAIAVSNVAPTAQFVSPTSVTAGTVFALTFKNLADSPRDLAAGLLYAFDCDADGRYAPSEPLSSASTVTCAGFASSGTVTLRGKVQDKDGGTREYTATVVVQDGPPTVTVGASLASVGRLSRGVYPVRLKFTFTDGSGDGAWTYRIDVTNSRSATPNVVLTGSSSRTGEVTTSQVNLASAPYTVSVVVTDRAGVTSRGVTTTVVVP
jgi:probable HAF family extracellular repeat protein